MALLEEQTPWLVPTKADTRSEGMNKQMNLWEDQGYYRYDCTDPTPCTFNIPNQRGSSHDGACEWGNDKAFYCLDCGLNHTEIL